MTDGLRPATALRQLHEGRAHVAAPGVPVIADAGTGHGNALSARRTSSPPAR